MSSLQEKIRADMIQATKQGDKFTVGVLRMMLSEIIYGATASKPSEEEDTIRRYKKKIADSMEDYKSDTEKLNKLQAEVQLIASYLPKEASKDELEAFVKTITPTIPFGQIMKQVKARYPSSDGRLVSDIVKAHIAG